MPACTPTPNAAGGEPTPTPRLPRHIRDRVELDLLHLRAAREDVAALEERIAALLSPATARLSHIGSQRGRPSNPTCSRGLAVAALRGRIREQAWVVHALDRWLYRLRRGDRALISLLYGIDEEGQRTLVEAAHAAGILCRSRAEERLVADRVQTLLASAAHALRYTRPGRKPAWQTAGRRGTGRGDSA